MEDRLIPEVLTRVDLDDSIEKLTGRDLDAAIAERVTGWQASQVEGIVRREGMEPPHYSTSIEAAMGVVERLSFGLSFALWRTSKISSVSNGWTAAFTKRVYPPEFTRPNNECDFWGFSLNSPAEAICRAALKAVGVK